MVFVPLEGREVLSGSRGLRVNRTCVGVLDVKTVMPSACIVLGHNIKEYVAQATRSYLDAEPLLSVTCCSCSVPELTSAMLVIGNLGTMQRRVGLLLMDGGSDHGMRFKCPPEGRESEGDWKMEDHVHLYIMLTWKGAMRGNPSNIEPPGPLFFTLT